MRVLVCGDRKWDDSAVVYFVLDGFDQNTANTPLEVISGMAKGADTHAAEWAEKAGAPLHSFYAKWEEHGKAAGPIRNQQMLNEGVPDLVIAFHDDLPNSKGTADMVRRAKAAGIPVYLVSRP